VDACVCGVVDTIKLSPDYSTNGEVFEKFHSNIMIFITFIIVGYDRRCVFQAGKDPILEITVSVIHMYTCMNHQEGDRCGHEVHEGALSAQTRKLACTKDVLPQILATGT